MLTTLLLYILTFIIAGFSVYIKLFLLDKNLFSLKSENLINNIFFWLMFAIFIIIILYRLLKDCKLVFEIIKANKELKTINIENINENYIQIDESFSNDKKYKKLGYYWKVFKKTLFLGNNNEYYQTIDAEEFYNKENLLQDKMNFRLMNYIPQLLVGLGMLGTFLGLSIGLADLNLGTDDTKQLMTLISGTKTAFYTSLYGMYFSISISMLFNIYLGFYEEKILNLKNKLNSIFKRYIKDEKIEEIKNEIIQVRENTHELSINVGKELVKGVQEYNKSSKEHLHNLTQLVNTNISGLADNVSVAFEEKLQKIFSKDFITPFIELKDRLLTISQHNNEEVVKYANLVSDISKNLVEIKNSIGGFTDTTLVRFNSIMDRVEDKYKEINDVTEESKNMYIKYAELLNNSKDIIVSSNQYLEELDKISNIFVSFTNQEEKLVEFWNKNRDIMNNLTETLERTKIEELKRVDEYQQAVLLKLDEYCEQFNIKIKEQEEKMSSYYKKHLEELFREYDSSMGNAIMLFKGILGQLEEKLYKIEDNVKNSNSIIEQERNLIEERYKASQAEYVHEMKQTSEDYKNMMSSLATLSKDISNNLRDTTNLIKTNNLELQNLRKEKNLGELIEVNNNINSRLEELNIKISSQLDRYTSSVKEEKEILKMSYKEMNSLLKEIGETQSLINATQNRVKEDLMTENLNCKKMQEEIIKILKKEGQNNEIKAKPIKGPKIK